MSSPFRVDALDDRTSRDGFDCGSEVLDRYFQTQVAQAYAAPGLGLQVSYRSKPSPYNALNRTRSSVV